MVTGVSAGIIAAVGAYQTYNDYKKADPADKKTVLTRDCIILAGTALGAIAGANQAEKIIEKKIHNNKSPSLLHKEYIEDLWTTICGLLTGATTGQITENIFPEKAKKQEIQTIPGKESPKGKLKFSREDINESMDGLTKAYTLAGLELASRVDVSLLTLAGFNVGRERGLENKIKKGIFEIIAKVAVPTAIICPFAVFTKNMHFVPKTLCFMPAILSGLFIGNALGEWFNKRVTEKLLKKELWIDISKRQQALIKVSMEGIQSRNMALQSEVMKNMEKLREMKNKMATQNFSQFIPGFQSTQQSTTLNKART